MRPKLHLPHLRPSQNGRRLQRGPPQQQLEVTDPRSSCAANTVLVGLNYLKDQPPVLALPDEAYPPWLWTLLNKSELPDDGPGGKAEKQRLRKENRQRIRDQNFMKTQ
ncbi:mitochondrial ribosomal protein L37-domain-containing protein [Russula brevipes]|nr:mitochondrial ribosomal protein L37-domain-containing protein [Russula brevipes]